MPNETLMLLRGAGGLAALYVLSYMTGDLVHMRFGRRGRGTEKLLDGFIWLLAAFTAAAFPFYILRYRVGFTPLVWLYTALTAAVIVLWLVFCRRGGRARRRPEPFWQDVWFWLCAVLLVEHMLTVLRGYEQCSDDQLYISISNIACEQDIITYALSAWGGMGSLLTTSNPFSAWELFVAWMARLLAVRPVYLYRSFLPLLTMPLCYLSAYEAGRRLFGTERRARIFLVLYGVLLLFSHGPEAASHGTFLFWMGKAVFYYFLLPRILCYTIDIVEERDGRFTWLSAAAALLAGAGLTTIGQYSGLIYIFALGVPYLVSLLRRGGERRARVRQVVRNVLLCALPVLALLFYTFFSQYHVLIGRNLDAAEAEITDSVSADEYMTAAEDDTLAARAEEALTEETAVEAPGPLGTWLTALKYRRCSDGAFLLLGALAIVSLAFAKNRTLRLLFFFGPVTLLLTFLNPLLADFVSLYVTTAWVYWRLWLLMTFDLITAAALVYWLHTGAERLRPAAPAEDAGEEKAVPAAEPGEEDELARLERELAQAKEKEPMSGDRLAGLLCAAALALLVTLSLTAGPGYRYRGLSTVDNPEHALPACDDLIRYLCRREGSDEFSLLADRIEFRSMPRQFSSHINVFIGRWNSFGVWTVEGTDCTFYRLEKLVYGDRTLGSDDTRAVLEKLGADYIVSEVRLDTAGSDYVLDRTFTYDYMEFYLYARGA